MIRASTCSSHYFASRISYLFDSCQTNLTMRDRSGQFRNTHILCTLNRETHDARRMHSNCLINVIGLIGATSNYYCIIRYSLHTFHLNTLFQKRSITR